MNKYLPILTGLIIICFSVAIVLMKQLFMKSGPEMISTSDTQVAGSAELKKYEESRILHPKVVVPEQVFINEQARFLDLTTGASEWTWEIAETGKKFSTRFFSTAFTNPGDYSLLLNVKSGCHSADTVFFVRVRPSGKQSRFLSDKEFASVFKEVSNNLGRDDSFSDRLWNEKLVSQCGLKRTMYVQVVFDYNKSETVLLEEYRENLLLLKYKSIRSVSEISRNETDGSIAMITVFTSKNTDESYVAN